MRTTLLFIDSDVASQHASERNCATLLENATPTPEFILELVRPTMKNLTHCRVGVLVVKNGKLKTKEPWFAERFASLDKIPVGAFYDLDPQSTKVIEDDMEVSVSLPAFLAVFQR